MFDPTTAQLLQSAPRVPGLDPQRIPALLTTHYANLVSSRLRGAGDDSSGVNETWSAERLADTYELIASVQTDHMLRRASAFVAATAQQILARKGPLSNVDGTSTGSIDRDRVDATIAAAVLFLAAEQYADANEAASAIRSQAGSEPYEATILSEHIADLARGQLGAVLDRAKRWRRQSLDRSIDDAALAALLDTLISGVEIFAAHLLAEPIPLATSGHFDSARAAFVRVLELSAEINRPGDVILGANVVRAYAGPCHLASLLIAAYDGINDAALTHLPPPNGADTDFWRRWLRLRARSVPFIWPNHREAIAKQFHQTGWSSVVVLPTGAGKTTISSLKIAGVLARGKKVVFLAPTHALVEQLTVDLQEMFPQEILGSIVSSEVDLLFSSTAQLQTIEVMTPERCLAMLSFAPQAFSDVGLLVFDECHLLSPSSDKIRRAIDGMLCLLGFNHGAPAADLLFLSAMLKNAEEFAAWIGYLTGRPCVSVDLLWKPSRQARGVLIYRNDDVENVKKAALSAQTIENEKQGKVAKGLRTVAAEKLAVHPWAIWGLKHNWLDQKKAFCILRQLLDSPVPLAGDNKYGPIYLKPNVNNVAVRLAVSALRGGLKSIVFVNTKNDAISVARKISMEIDDLIGPTKAEQERWDALQSELGDLRHALIQKQTVAVPHNSSMFRLERELAERMFKRNNGAKVIVATPTLAQGLNLPAHLAILAGDKRSDADQTGRESLEAHEILNAAARAGRAGHLANGVVVLIPEPLISFTQGEGLDSKVIAKLKSILPEDDRCISISDPLEVVLDRLMQGESPDRDVRYLTNRMAAFRELADEEDATSLFNLRKSFGAFAARERHAEAEFEAKITDVKKAIARNTPDGIDHTIAILASQSGLAMEVLVNLKKRIIAEVGSLPSSVDGWLRWTIAWLVDDESARTDLLYDVKRSIRGACGLKKDGEVTALELTFILPGLVAWITGQPIAAIETALGGNPDEDSVASQVCPRARELVGGVIPRGLSFVMGLVSRTIEEVDPFEAQGNLSRRTVECLCTAVRRGYDAPEKVIFAGDHPAGLSRVQMHTLWAHENVST